MPNGDGGARGYPFPPKRKTWREILQAERSARVTLSPGPMNNRVAWNPETDVPDANRTDPNRPRRMTSGEIAGAGMRRLLATRAAPLTQAGVYRAIAPARPAGMEYNAYLALPLSFRLVATTGFEFDATEDDLLAWLDEVQAEHVFDPAEVLVIRDQVAFENTYRDRLGRPYTTADLLRRARRFA